MTKTDGVTVVEVVEVAAGVDGMTILEAEVTTPEVVGETMTPAPGVTTIRVQEVMNQVAEAMSRAMVMNQMIQAQAQLLVGAATIRRWNVIGEVPFGLA